MKEPEQEKYNELAYYTLSLRDSSFIHQYIVDAFTAQNADEQTKPIAITFALVGLYLCVEKNFTGKQVQQVHVKLAKNKRQWPVFQLPGKRGKINISDVLKASPGQERNEMIRKWCVSVWTAFRSSRKDILSILNNYNELKHI